MGIDGTAEQALGFDTAEFAISATYTPVGGGSPTSVAVLFDLPISPAALGRIGAQQQNHKLQCLASVVASPREGDTWVIPTGGSTYKGGPKELNPDGTIWTIFLNKQ